MKERVCLVIMIKKWLISFWFNIIRPSPPNLKDMENDEFIKLSIRLKGDSEKDTLTNILEWQDRNIAFWWERWPLANIIFLWPLLITLFILSIALAVLLILIFFSILTTQDLYIFLEIPKILDIGLPYFILFALLMALYFKFRYRKLSEGKTILKKSSKFIQILYNTFCLSPPIGKILEYKLAVCRDYAKFTSSLLLKIYSDSNICYITKRQHVAAGIEINDKIYVLDQQLPILSLDNWQKKMNTKAVIYKRKIDKRSKKKQIDTVFDRIEPKPEKLDKSPPIQNEKLIELTEEIAQILKIKQGSHVDNTSIKIDLPDYAKYYDDDKRTKYSLIRAIKNKIESELCSNIDNISKIKISQKNETDLTVEVCL